MAFMASEPMRLFQAKEIAECTAISQPTVSKLLKILTKNKLLDSTRGAHGGYKLAAKPQEITVAMLIHALEGPIAITECNLGHDYCASAPQCAVKTPWLRINQAITRTLQSVKLEDLTAIGRIEHLSNSQRLEVRHA